MQIHDFNNNVFKSFFKKINRRWFIIAFLLSAAFIAFIFFYYYSNTLARNSGNIENLKNNSATQQTTAGKVSGTVDASSGSQNNQLMNDINSELNGSEAGQSSSVPSGNSGTGWSAVLKMALGLAVVVVLIYLTVFLLKFINKSRTAEGLKFKKEINLIKIIDSINIAPNKSITLVSVAGKMLILGVTDKGINFLSEIAPGKTKDVEEFLSEYSEADSEKPNFKNLLTNYFKK
jgi:flagellar biogenesis protein FliO